jgi:hypothetical protein
VTVATSPRSTGARAHLTDARNSISFVRLLWAAPLVVTAGVAINRLIALAAQTIDPSFGVPASAITTLTLEGCVGAVLVFAGLAYFVPRPIFWYRLVSTIALVLSLAPVVALGMGGTFARLGLQLISQVEGIGAGGQPGGGGPMSDGGSMPGARWPAVLCRTASPARRSNWSCCWPSCMLRPT